MATPRLVILILILSSLSSGGLATTAWADGGRATASAGSTISTGEYVEVDFPSVASASDSFMGNAGVSYSSTAFASPAMRLSVSATSTGWANTSPRYTAQATVTVMEDTTFNYQPDYTGEMDDWVEVGLTGVLSGTITGSGQGSPVGAAWPRAQIAILGPIYTAPPDEGGVPASASVDTGQFGRGGAVASGEVIDINEFLSTGYVWVRRGEPIGFTAALTVTIVSVFNPFGSEPGHHGTVEANFADTFAFDPYNFFDIRTPGITANSPSLGLVNNRLTAVIPEPTSVLLLVLGLSGLAVVVRRR